MDVWIGFPWLTCENNFTKNENAYLHIIHEHSQIKM